ncbi:MAG: superoxide dismutase [Defluviitaleaceae bacterium]|nr:superoxide dismutase [Defluviitaleaceae bacterium]
MSNSTFLSNYPFEKPPLPYNYNSLEPFIDTKTMHLHYDKHLQTYIDNLNKIISKHNELWGYSLQELITNPGILPTEINVSVLRNAGGVYNHVFYFQCMAEGKAENPSEIVIDLINKSFGNFDKFKNDVKEAALGVFGSGYMWLVFDLESDSLRIIQLANQETPLNIKDVVPILNLDVWEHAYYLKNYNNRDEYINNWFNVVNWKFVECNIWLTQKIQQQKKIL